ncbi:frigida-LIKE protein [Medicago truncatula]|uniref:FRIGIDA-like protein n=2 Tax=Medicago truncatula TaxID=3880 RepID=A0A072VM64_MEDTR|nr:frigida-LIKE protein [Medicago truncatula]
MDFKGSDNSEFCGVGEKSIWHPVSYDDADYDDDVPLSRRLSIWHPVSYDDADYDDDVPLSRRLSHMSNLVTRFSNRDIPLKKRRTATMPLSVKRPFYNSSSLNDSVEKSKASQYGNQDKEKDDAPLSRDFVSSKMKKQFEERVRDLQLKEKRCAERAVELEAKEKLFEGRVKELKLKENRLKGEVKEFELKLEKFHWQTKELESKKKNFDSRVKELNSKERQFKGWVKQLELKEEQFKGQVKELELEKKQFEEQLKDIRSKEKLVEVQVKEFDGRGKEFESKEDGFNARKQKLKGFVSQMEDLKSEEKHFEGRGKELKSNDKMFKVDAKVLNPKEKQTKSNKFDEETELVTSYIGNQLSPDIDERSLMLLSCEQTDELELFDDDILGNLQGSSDPSKVVLDIIQNPIIKKCKIGDDAVIIDDSHILLLKELRKISLDIKPHVKEEAMKLALDLKANISQNTENSAAILGFLLLLSIYGLGPSFNEDDVLKLFGLVSQHDIAVELFGALGFANKISDFVQSLIKRQQYDEAVRFSCAYNFSNNTQLVDIFQEHVQNLNLIFESSCKEANSIEIKDKA